MSAPNLWVRMIDRTSEASARQGGVRRVRRGGDKETPQFDLAYVRSGPPSDTPTVVIPGGPGLSSGLPYMGFRRQAGHDGLDTIMIDHRGVGLSRFDVDGQVLPDTAMWIEKVVEDIAAVLDAEGADRAFLAGSSYGSYLASRFAAEHPERVAGLLLDSPLQSAHDINIERKAIRALFWDADTSLAAKVRELSARGEDDRKLLDVMRAAYELDGADVAETLAGRRLDGKWNPGWDLMSSYADRSASMTGVPGFYEFDRAGTIGFRELNYAPAPDGRPLDPALTYSLLQDDFPRFVGEAVDLVEAADSFNFPTVLLLGDRDLRTPRQIAERTATHTPDPTLVTIHNGHSALDTHNLAFTKTLKLLTLGQQSRLPDLSEALSGMPHRGDGAKLAKLLRASAALP